MIRLLILLMFGQELKEPGQRPDTPSPGSALVFMVGLSLALVTFGIWPALHLTRTPAGAGLTTGAGATAPTPEEPR